MNRITTRFSIAAIFVLWTAVAGAQDIGRAILVIGEVSVLRGGVEAPLARNAGLRSGDIVKTGAASNAQLRMNDESLIALRPSTEFRIDEFRYAGKEDGSERGFFSLLKGGFRTVTGLVGRGNRDNYKVSTPTATIGIRGTHFTVVHCQDDCDSPNSRTASVHLASLELAQSDAGQPGFGSGGNRTRNGTYGGVQEGRISLTNEARVENQFGAGEFFFVADVKTPAQRLISPPDFLRDRLDGQSRSQKQGNDQKGDTSQANLDAGNVPQAPVGTPQGQAPLPTDYRVTDEKNNLGDSPVIAGPRGDGVYPTSTNMAFMSAEYNPSSSFHNAWNSISGGMSITTDSTGVLTANSYLRNDAKAEEAGADGGVLAWVRWSDGTPTLWAWGNQTLTVNQGFHLIVGDLSTSLPAQNSVTFSLIGSTQPTETRAGALGGWSVTSGTITANFLSTNLTGSLGLRLLRTGEQGTFTMNFSGPAYTGFNSISSTVTRTGGTAELCVTGCSGAGTVMFAGPNASHAGMIYEFNAGAYYVQGAAAFKR